MPSTINASTSSGIVQTADTSGVLELQSNGTTRFTVASTGAYGQLVSGTAVASTSGTSIDFTGIPSWVKRITVMFQGVSTNGTSSPQIQLGTGSTTYTTTGYQNQNSNVTTSGATISSNTTGGFATASGSAANTLTGQFILSNLNGNTWVGNGMFFLSTSGYTLFVGGITLGAPLTAIRVTTVNGTDTFDAGSINILYEG